MDPGITQQKAFEQTTSDLLPDVMQVRLRLRVVSSRQWAVGRRQWVVGSGQQAVGGRQ